MPNDSLYGAYTASTLVKGSWYGYKAGPKPQEYDGNIDSVDNLEIIRNVAIIINSAGSSNGTFPSGYSRKYAVLTTRYGTGIGLYVQKCIDLSDSNKIEWLRIWDNGWSSWKRVSTVGDASGDAAQAKRDASAALAAIDEIDTAIGGRKAKESINSRVKKNTDNITSIVNQLGQTPSGTTVNGRLNSLDTSVGNLSNGYANDSVARDHTNKIVNGDVREGQLPGIKFYANQNAFSIGGADSVKVLDTGNMRNWGFNGNNSVFIVSNANSDLNGAHVEGGTFVPDDGSGNRGGWYAVFEGSTNTDIILNWVLIVFNQTMQ